MFICQNVLGGGDTIGLPGESFIHFEFTPLPFLRMISLPTSGSVVRLFMS